MVAWITCHHARIEPGLGTRAPPTDLFKLLQNYFGFEEGGFQISDGTFGMARSLKFFGDSILVSLGIFIPFTVLGFNQLRRSGFTDLAWALLSIIFLQGLVFYASGANLPVIRSNLSHAAMFLLIGHGLQSLIESQKIHHVFQKLIIGIPAITLFISMQNPLAQLKANNPYVTKVDRHDLQIFEKTVRLIFRKLPPHSVIFAEWPIMTGIRYHQHLEKIRPDILAFESRDHMWYQKTFIKDYLKAACFFEKSRPVYFYRMTDQQLDKQKPCS